MTEGVITSGRLEVQSFCSTLACPSGACCNRCSATVRIETEGRTLSLGAPNDPSFVCVGDDSGVCCGPSVRRGVVRVTGVFRRARLRCGSDHIENASLCVE